MSGKGKASALRAQIPAAENDEPPAKKPKLEEEQEKAKANVEKAQDILKDSQDKAVEAKAAMYQAKKDWLEAAGAKTELEETLKKVYLAATDHYLSVSKMSEYAFASLQYHMHNVTELTTPTSFKKPQHTPTREIKRDAIQLVAQEAASTFGSFSYNNTASWVHLLNPEVYHTAPYRYKEGNFQLKDFIPISLLYKGFGNFLKLYTSQDPSSIDLDDMKFLQSFIISMAMIYPSEEDRNKAALKALNDYIGIKYTIFGPTKNADGVMLLNRRVVLLFEGKNEQCSTGYDPEMQSICYYSKYIEENFESSPSPSIIIIISGPNISIVGIINGTLHVIVENLVPTLRLAYIPGSHITNSLCFCFKALKAFISEASEDQFDATSDYPYFTSFKHLNCDATLEYICNLKRLVYVAKMIWTETENNTKHEDFVIVKFTNTYGVEAHKWMADKGGMAPQFIAIHDLPPNWKVVIMEKLHTIDTDVNYDVVRKVIKEFHEAGFVHGDLRPSNIISCSNTKLGIAVIDYDWAGKANEAKYPLWMNPACIWPQNASCGQIITADHDNHWLQQGSTLDADI